MSTDAEWEIFLEHLDRMDRTQAAIFDLICARKRRRWWRWWR